MNRLAESLSPYLLQHQTNPVDWYPWGDEAFELAKQRDRPIFLSVGYAACHWCHVMEHESFENKTIAEFLNENFVSIKVDREERPDIDQIYMNAVQVMTGRGGWPMSVFLDHDRKPFYAGTYWPPVARQGMPGFSQVIDAINDAWRNRREEVMGHADQITEALQQLASGSRGAESNGTGAGQVPPATLIHQATDYLLSVLDQHEGGFGSAPKFPHATDLQLLLRRAAVTNEQSLVDAAVLTLDKMACGGIRDHIGGGFARYSVDGHWLVPHFEKMLYDNGLLAEVYLRAFQVTGEQRHADVACEILDYLARDMVDPAGGLHCSEDADSEGVEGKFYVWTPAEVVEVLGQQRGERFCQIYDITEGGNFEGNSIPHLKQPIESAELLADLAQDCEALRLHREGRVHPGRDDKILVAWNALAIKAFALAGSILDRPGDIAVAIRAADFIFEKMTRDDGRLLHAYRGGQAHLDAYVDDYAYLAEACITLFEATGNSEWIEKAIGLGQVILDRFSDHKNGGFYYTADDAEVLITRNKDWHDGSLVSGNASAAAALWRLAMLTDRTDFREAVEKTLACGSEVLREQSAACGAMIAVLDLYHGESEQWVFAVPDDETRIRIRTKYFKQYRPHVTLSWVSEASNPSSSVFPINENRTLIQGQATYYRCQNFACDQPVVGEENIETQL
jgi:uncharacterized protein YyaL (SSP411 family)